MYDQPFPIELNRDCAFDRGSDQHGGVILVFLALRPPSRYRVLGGAGN